MEMFVDGSAAAADVVNDELADVKEFAKAAAVCRNPREEEEEEEEEEALRPPEVMPEVPPVRPAAG